MDKISQLSRIKKRADRAKDKKQWRRFSGLVNSLNCPKGCRQHISFGKTEMANGRYHVVARCSECQTDISKPYVKKSSIPDEILDKLPTFTSYVEDTCEVCGGLGVEIHHWAPRKFFGDDCEKWPKSRLCPDCHQLWHNTITIPLLALQREKDKSNGA